MRKEGNVQTKCQMKGEQKNNWMVGRIQIERGLRVVIRRISFRNNTIMMKSWIHIVAYTPIYIYNAG